MKTASILFVAALACALLLDRVSAQVCNSTTLTPEQEQGPYYIAEELFRENITEGQSGVPLYLSITVLDEYCEPLADVFVDIWHCNATGYYSGFTTKSSSGPTGRRLLSAQEGLARRNLLQLNTPTDNLTFLRGQMPTDDVGYTEFQTIYPGFYTGRAIHIHIKVHVPKNATATTSEAAEYENSYVSHTGQFLFDDAVSELLQTTVYPYTTNAAVQGSARTLNADDRVFTQQGGSSQLLNLTQVEAGKPQFGYYGSVTLQVNSSAVASAVALSAGAASGAMAPGFAGGPRPANMGPMPGTTTTVGK